MRIPGFFLFFCILLLPVLTSADEFYESQLNSGIKNSEVSSYLLLKQAGQDKAQSAALLNQAVEYSPDLPAAYFELARSRFSLSYSGILDSIDFMVAGLNAYSKNFWWSFNLAGAAFFSLVLSFIAVIGITVIIRTVIDLPLLSHEIEESSQNFMLPAVLVLLSLLSPLLFLAGFLVLLGLYMSRTDKIVVYLFLVFLLISPLFFRTASQFLGVSSSGAMKAVVGVNESKDNTYALTALKSSDHPAEILSYALALKRSGFYDEAISAYARLVNTKGNAVAYVNLGNVYVGKNNRSEAVNNYLAAIKIRPLASAYYNLSQLAREDLDFEKGNNYFSKALELDRNAVLGFRAMYGRNPNRIVADETLSSSGLWNIAWKSDIRTSTFNLSVLPVWTISLVSLFLIIAFYVLNNYLGNKAYRCRRCNKIFCPQCEKHVMWGQMCPQCFRSLIKLEEIEVKDRVAQLMSIYEHQKQRRSVMKILSFIIPGSSYIYGGKILYGFIFMWPFLFLLLFPLITLFMAPDARGSHWVLNLVSLLAAAVLLVLSNIFIRQRISKGWL